MDKPFRLPDGSYTKYADDYSYVWRALARPIEEAMEAKLHAFDPGLQFTRKDGRSIFTVPTDLAMKFEELWRASKELHKEEKRKPKIFMFPHIEEKGKKR